MLAGFQETAGLKFIVLMLDLMAWKRPIQPVSYSVTRPQGPFRPTPADHASLIGITKVDVRHVVDAAGVAAVAAQRLRQRR